MLNMFGHDLPSVQSILDNCGDGQRYIVKYYPPYHPVVSTPVDRDYLDLGDWQSNMKSTPTVVKSPIVVCVPGIAPEKIDVQLKGNSIVVQVQDRAPQCFPVLADIKNITAVLKYGMLTISFILPAEKTKTIAVTVE